MVTSVSLLLSFHCTQWIFTQREEKEINIRAQVAKEYSCEGHEVQSKSWTIVYNTSLMWPKVYDPKITSSDLTLMRWLEGFQGISVVLHLTCLLCVKQHWRQLHSWRYLVHEKEKMTDENGWWMNRKINTDWLIISPVNIDPSSSNFYLFSSSSSFSITLHTLVDLFFQ